MNVDNDYSSTMSTVVITTAIVKTTNILEDTTSSSHPRLEQQSVTGRNVSSHRRVNQPSCGLPTPARIAFKNKTTALFPGSTNRTAFPSSTHPPNASLSSHKSASFANNGRPSSSTKTQISANTTTSLQSFSASGSVVSIRNSTFSGLASSTISTGGHYNTTSVTSALHFVNGTLTTSTSTSTPTLTIDRACGETSTLFAVRVVQPGGMFDGWFLKLSADAIIFVPPEDSSSSSSSSSSWSSPTTPTRFSVDGSSGRLCTTGARSNAVIAIAENATDVAGSGVYFVDPEVLNDIGRLGYAALQCRVVDSRELRCAEGVMEYWAGCGLGLDITSSADGGAEIGGWNCTGVTLSAVYS